MNQVSTMNVVHKMTSREIAGLTGKQHKNVIRDIESMADGLGSNLSQALKSGTYSDANGVARKQYELDYEMTMTLITGYSVRLRNAVIKRWQELERPQHSELPTDYVSALEHLLASTKREQEASRQLALAAPKVDFADRVSNGKGTMTRRNAAKCLQHPPMAFNQWLKDNRFSNRDGMPSQNEIKRGHQRVVVGENNGHTHSTPRITAKGLLYYAVKLYSSEVPDDVLGNIESFKKLEM